ncbi:MAG: uroporphyrinogen-III C-methyltransferase [Lysobacterales bacterium]
MQAVPPPSDPSTDARESSEVASARPDSAVPASESPRQTRAQHTPAKPQGQQPAPRGGAGWLLWLVVLLALGSGGWSAWQLWQQSRAVQAEDPAPLLAEDPAFRELERKLAQAQQRLGAAEAHQRDDQAVNDVLREQLLTLTQRLALSEQTLADVVGQSAPQGQPGTLDQAEYLLLAAQARLDLFADLDGARRALRLADRTLASSTDPLASAVRGGIAAELDALDAVPRVDGAALQARLGALFADLDDWPLPGEASSASETAETAPWYRAWLRLDNYLSIRRVAPDAGLDPFQLGATRLDVRAQLSLARMLLLQRRYDELPAVLAGLNRSLEAFDGEHAGVARARAGLTAIAREPFNQALPQGGVALEELRRLRGLRSAVDNQADDRP